MVMEPKKATGNSTKFVDLYELLQIDMNADSDTLRKRIQQMYVEAQQNLDHRNAEKRIHFQQVHEIYMPQARYLLLDPARRMEYNRYLMAYRSGNDIAPIRENMAADPAVFPTDAEAAKGEVLPALTPEGEHEAQQFAEHHHELWSHWKDEIERELAQSREELARQKRRNARLLWGAGAAVVVLGAALFAMARQPASTVSTPAVPVVQEPPNLLRNGKMTERDDNKKTPTAWAEFWSERGRMAATHDTKVFRSEPASLCLGSVQDKQGNLKGQVAQEIPVQPGQRLRLKGFLKTAGQAQAQILLIARPQFKIETAIFLSGNNDWTPLEKEYTVPPGTENLAIGLYMEGKGRAWLDDAELTEVKPAAPGSP
jgi:hypothetical protein